MKILIELQSRGIAVPSQTILQGRYAIRVCNTNHRSEMADFDLLVAAVKSIGAELVETEFVGSEFEGSGFERSGFERSGARSH